MSGGESPSYGRTKSIAELVEQDPFQTRSSRSDVPPWPKDDEILKSRHQLHKPLLSQVKESDFGSRRGLRKQGPDSDEGGRVAASRYPSPPKGNNNMQSLQNARDSSNTSDQCDYILDLADPDRITSIRRLQKHPATFQCTLCPKRFTRAYNFRSHLRTHTDERPFVCTICSKAFARQHDRKRHEGLHSGEKKFVCRGVLQGSVSASWGCGRRFARADALGRHFRSEEGRVCIKPLLDEEADERQKAWLEERHLAGLVTPRPMTTAPYHDHMNNFLPAALLLQYPALAGLDWNSLPRGPPPDEEAYSGRSSFDASSGGESPSADPTFSDGLGPLGLSQLSLNNGSDATQSFYGLGSSPHISPRLIAQHMGLPAFTADNNFGMGLAHSGQSIQPADGPKMFPSYEQDSSEFPRATPSQQSESEIKDLQVALIVVPQARDDASPRHFSNDEHSHINGTVDRPNSDVLLANPMWSHKARSVDLNDPSTDMAASTAQMAPEDAKTSNTESGLSDYRHRAPPQSTCDKDLATSDLDEHELTETTTGPPLVRTAAPNFGEARSELELLRLGIDTLEDSSESSSDISRGEPDLLTDSQYSSQADSVPDTTGPTNDNEEGVEGHDDYRGSSQVDTGSSHDTGTLHSSAQGYSRKRQRHHGINDGYAHLGVCLGEKGSGSTCKRFVCCFQHGPGRNCPGTDETISEVLKKLSEHHDTHVCDRCWVLKVKDESSGLLVHPDDVLECLDHCLSPQCHRTTPTIGHRHRFDQGTCKTKTSRVRPGDGEAVYRFIFSLVHPTLESPVEVVTAEHSLHLGAVPRQGRRKATREELTAQADRLGKRLEDLERQHIEGTDQVNHLKQELSDAHSNAERDREKTASLEARLRRVVAILGDALRTGKFRDQQDHRSLLMRVGEDAPAALSLLSHPSPSPPESTNGQQPSFLPTREKTNATAECQLFQDTYPMITNSAALDKTLHSDSLEIRTSQVPTMGLNVGDQEMEIDWLNLLDESGNTSNISAYLDGFS
jgi:hypothetical protein